MAVRKRNPAILFVKTLVISLVLLFTLILASGFALMKAKVRPPEIPIIAHAADNITMESDITEDVETEVDLDGLDAEELDAKELVEEKPVDELRAPEGFSSFDRKELFYTFLIICLDGGVNTDTIIVASYDGVNKNGNVISVPRDCLVNAKRNIRKINGAYPMGTLNGGGMEGGVAQLKHEIKTIIGFEPDFYICINFEAFEEIIDAIGGIDVEVPFDMNYYDPAQDLRISINKGLQQLDGKEALKFARYRKGNGSPSITDYQRIENQQAVIAASLDKLINPVNILKLPEFIKIFSERVHTDIKFENLLWFADQINNIRETDALAMYTMPTKGTSGLPNYYEFLDEPAVLELVNQTINPFNKNIESKDVDIIDYE